MFFKPVHLSELMAYFTGPGHLICSIFWGLLFRQSDTFDSDLSTRTQAKASWSCGHTLFIYLVVHIAVMYQTSIDGTEQLLF